MELMIDIILVLVIACLLGYIAWDREKTSRERETMIRAIIAKNANEMRDMQAVDKIQVKADITPQPVDLQPLDQISDEDFDKAIKEEIKRNG